MPPVRGEETPGTERVGAAVSQAEGQRFPSSSKWKVTDALGASVSSFVKSGAGADGGGRGMPDSGLRGKRNELPHESPGAEQRMASGLC